MNNEKRHFVVVKRHEFTNSSGAHFAVVAHAVEATSAEDAAAQYANDSSIAELRVIPVGDVPTIDLAAVRAWRAAKWKREQEEEDREELEHALEVVARHREKMGEAKL